MLQLLLVIFYAGITDAKSYGSFVIPRRNHETQSLVQSGSKNRSPI